MGMVPWLRVCVCVCDHVCACERAFVSTQSLLSNYNCDTNGSRMLSFMNASTKPQICTSQTLLVSLSFLYPVDLSPELLRRILYFPSLHFQVTFPAHCECQSVYSHRFEVKQPTCV